MSIIKQEFGSFQDMATQHMLAPILQNLVNDTGAVIPVDSYFIFNNELYKVTADIASGATIVIGTTSGCNANYAKTITEEMNDTKNINYSDINNIPHTIGASGTSFDDANAHIATNDGYLFIQAGSQSTDQASAYIGSSYYVTVKTGTAQMIFVRKGTSYKRRTNQCVGQYVLEFTPLS